MFYDVNQIKEILETNPITEVIKRETPSVVLKENNQLRVDICPFCGSHDTMYLKNNECYCYSCGTGGNAIGFLMKYKNIDFVTAVSQLAKYSRHPHLASKETKKFEVSVKSQKIMEINAVAAKYYYDNLRKTPNPGYNYFDSRLVTDKMKNSFGLGYAGPFGSNLYNLLVSKGFTEAEIMNSGLVSKSTKPSAKTPYYDKFWDRVIFPIFDQDGKVIAFGGRVLGDDKPKYLNSPETSAFKKGDNLFCYNRAKKSKHDYYICCEGYMDAMSLHQFGFDSAVASLGTALTTEQIKLLSNKSRVILAYDSDDPGIKATRRAIQLCREAGIPAKVLHLYDAKDPDEFLKKFGEKALNKLIRNAESDQHFMVRTSKVDDKIDFENAVEELL